VDESLHNSDTKAWCEASEPLLNLKAMSNIYVRPTVFDENLVCLSLASSLKKDLKSSKSKHQQHLPYADAH
jgi:hypothetical protein